MRSAPMAGLRIRVAAAALALLTWADADAGEPAALARQALTAPAVRPATI
jgi:hypothetical protein